jgi:uracil-DNA glycosylase family 4
MINEGCYCRGCVNLAYGNRRVEAEGDGSSDILLVGDGPWKTEVEVGRPFAGASGQLLDRILKRLAINRPTLTITNSMCCQSPHLGWSDNPKKFPEALKALAQCEPYLADTLAIKKPKVIVCLGSVAMRQVVGVDADITQRHSYVHESLYNIPAIPTFHPSFLLQGKHKFEICLMFALRRAQEIANGTYVEDKFNLLLDPPIDIARAYLANYLRSHNNRIDLLMVDIETPESADLDEEEVEEKGDSYNIIRAGFSLDNNSAISFPFKQPYIDLLQEAISAADTFAEWADNHFDSKRLRAAGLVINGRVVSGMWAWHFYQSDLLKGLGFVAPFFTAGPPWKHLASSQPALYNALDQVIGRKATVGSMAKLAAEGRLDRFMRHCVDADKYYVQMGSMGVKLDTDHFGKFRDRLRVEYAQKVDELQPLIPDKIKVVKVWKRAPKVVTDAGYTDVRVGKNVERVKVERLEPGGCQAILPFNPGSPPQIKALIKSLGLKVPKDRDGETTGAKHLKRFNKYPIFHMIHVAKQRKTLIANYNWQVDDRGRIKTTYGYHPSTLRKSSRNYNLQVIPKRSDLADEFRRSIVAAPGHYLVTSDASAIEAVLVGYDAGSDSYIRLAKAGLHGWMTAAYHGQPIPLTLPFDELTKRCKAAKKAYPVDYETLKRVGHLSNYLGTPYRIYEEYPEEFASPIEAGKLQNFYFNTAPGREVRQWQSRVMNEAHSKTYLDNHFNYRHYFYSVYKWDSKTKGWLIDHDGDAKRAVAFRPQSDASAIQTEVILRVAEGYDKVLEYLRLIIHDEIVMEVPEDNVEDAATILHTEMTRPIPELPLADGSLLSIGAETKYGRNLAAYHPETNVNGMREMEVDIVNA